MYLLPDNCPKCGVGADLRNMVRASFPDIPDEPDVVWVETGNGAKRFDTCRNNHNFNIRPYFDYDEHYIYEGQLPTVIEETEKKLIDLRALLP